MDNFPVLAKREQSAALTGLGPDDDTFTTLCKAQRDRTLAEVLEWVRSLNGYNDLFKELQQRVSALVDQEQPNPGGNSGGH